MPNKRLIYSALQLGFSTPGDDDFIAAHGVQQVGITTTFNLEQVFELSQLQIYENIEQIPEVEVTMEKVLDGYPLLYHLMTNGATLGTLIGRSNVESDVCLGVFPDTLEFASGDPIAEVHMAKMSLSSLTYTCPVDGSSTESVTAVGNDKVWKDVEGADSATMTGAFEDGLDQPLSYPNSGGVQRREDVIFAPLVGSPTGVDENGASNGWCTILPTDIYGISSSGTNNYVSGQYGAHIQSITISTDLGRTPINELGRKSFYFRPINFPVEIRTEIEVIATKWDGISGDEAGGHNGAPAGSNLKNQTIRVQMREGTRIDCGTRNKLNSVAWSGGDATSGGSNVTNRYSYVGYNYLLVTHPADPSGL